MAEDWIGRAVSIVCDEKIGVFQGMIKAINASEITIVRAFRNGVPLRKQNAEIVLKSVDILKIELIPTVNGEINSVTPTVINKPTPVKLPNFLNILGAKERERQQKLQLQKIEQEQLQRQQQQNQKPRHQQQQKQKQVSSKSQSAINENEGNGTVEISTNYRGSGNGNDRGDKGGGGGNEAASSPSTSYHGNSTLSAKMEVMRLLSLSSNGLRSTPNNNVRASSAQQQHHQSYGGGSGGHNSSPPQRSNSTATIGSGAANSVALFFGGMIPPKVEVKLGSSYSNALTTLNMTSGGGGHELTNLAKSSIKPNKINGVSSSDQNCITNETNSCSGNWDGDGNGSQPIDIVSGSSRGVGGNYHNGNGSGGKRNGYNNSHNGYSNNSNKSSSKHQRNKGRAKQQQQTFSTPVDDPSLKKEFDFEGNLALFDKRRIWYDIELSNEQNQAATAGRNNTPSKRHELKANEKKYRHDENVLQSAPLQLRQIKTEFAGSEEFATDEGLIIPTIPQQVRKTIELTAEVAGLSLQRQVDLMARGASDLAISLLGGARRLTPNNSHQWPKIAIICDSSEDKNGIRSTDIGAATGRQLASHGLTVLLYLEQLISAQQSIEISLFKATDNAIVHSIDALPKPDLVILSTNAANMSEHIKIWLSENRASILAIDPPPCGINDVAIKYSILPILPLNGISTNNCGKLYLCNLGIPDKFYRDCGIKYKSPYGHKYVIPIHPKD